MTYINQDHRINALKKQISILEAENEEWKRKIGRCIQTTKALERAFDCSAHGIYFGYIGGSAAENFKDIEELLDWYRQTEAIDSKE